MTLPFGAALETALKGIIQNGKFSLAGGFVRNPRFFCCISGNPVGVDKAPVALLVVRPIRVCTAIAVTADYSRSWSPTSTINAWQVNWGDGNVSNGAWPGAGSVNHPLGGYVLPGIYTVTLTVTDLLGATDMDTQQIEILDCTVMVLPLFAGCGSSGIWYSGTGGIAWEERGGGILDGVEIYDLKASPFTIATYDRAGNPNVSNVLLWAATADGLHRSLDGGKNWQRITLPDPAGGVEEPVAYAVQPSTVLETEVHVFALKVSTNEAYVLRGIGLRRIGWTWLRVGVASLAVDHNVLSTLNAYGDSFAEYDDLLYFGFMYVSGVGWLHTGYATKDLLGNWADHPFMAITRPARYAVYDGKLYGLWVDEIGYGGGPIGYGLQVYNGASWSTVNWQTLGYGVWPRNISQGRAILAVEGVTGVYCISGNAVRRYVNTVEAAATNALGWGTINEIGYFDGQLYCIAQDLWGLPPFRIYRYSAGVWVQEYESANMLACLSVYDGHFWCIERNQLRVKMRQADGTWVDDDYEMPASANATAETLHVEDGVMYAAARDQTPAPDVNWVYRRVEGFGWVAIHANVASNFPLFGPTIFNNEQHYHVGFPTVMVPLYSGLHLSTTGRTHLMAMSSDGYYIYLGLLNAANQPVICRIAYDLSGVVTLHNPLAGTWGGVRADWFYSGRLWIFGDFGAASKVLMSEDWGNSFVDVTDAGWGAGEVVRPILPSLYDPDNVIAILNTALQAHESSDIGASWANNGAIAFACHCAERDWIEDLNLFIGHAGPAPTGANHLQYTPNLGISWIERSTGLTADAPIVALQVVG